MDNEIRIKFNSDGFKAILKSDGVKSLVQDNTQSIADRANSNLNDDSDGFSSEVIYGGFGGGRWVGFVSTTDFASMKAESEDKALSRAVR